MADLEALNRILKKMANTANKRISRAEEGQRSLIESYQERKRGASGWNEKTGSFTGAKAKSVKEAQRRIEELKDFIGSKTTTKTGYKEMVSKALGETGRSLAKQGYDFSQDELKDFFEKYGKELDQIGKESGKAERSRMLYYYLNTVEIENSLIDDGEGHDEGAGDDIFSADDLEEAPTELDQMAQELLESIEERISESKLLERTLKQRARRAMKRK